VQAGTFALLAPTLSYLNLPEWQCSRDLFNSSRYAMFVIKLYVNNAHCKETETACSSRLS